MRAIIPRPGWRKKAKGEPEDRVRPYWAGSVPRLTDYRLAVSSSNWIAWMPALAQASSCAPVAAPETPTAPMMLPAASIGMPPAENTRRLREAVFHGRGGGVEVDRGIGLLPADFQGHPRRQRVAHHHHGVAAAINHGHADLDALLTTGLHCGMGDFSGSLDGEPGNFDDDGEFCSDCGKGQQGGAACRDQ